MSKPTDIRAKRIGAIPPDLRDFVESYGSAILTAAEHASLAEAEMTATRDADPFLATSAAPHRSEMVRETLAACEALASPAAVAVARAIGVMTDEPELGARARDLADRLSGIVPVPPQLAAFGTARAVGAWQRQDDFGDQANLIIEFRSAAGADGIVLLIDHGWGRGFLKDIFPVRAEGLAGARESLDRRPGDPDWSGTGEAVPVAEALRMAAGAVRAAREDGELLPLDPDVQAHAGVLDLRLRDSEIEPYAPAPFGEAEALEAAARFLASPQGASLGLARPTALRWARELALWGADDELGRPLRAGGWKTEQFLFEYADPMAASPSERRAVGEVTRAWNAWRIVEEGLGAAAATRLTQITATMTAAFEAGDASGHVVRLEPESRGPSEPVDELYPVAAVLADELMADPSPVRDTSAPAPRGAGRTIRVRADVIGAKPPIWRRLLVPGQASLGQLSDALQVAFGWQGRFVHEFEQGRGYASRWWGDLEESLDGVADESAWEAQAVLHEGGPALRYAYFVGRDGFELRLKVERIEDEESRAFRCVAGRGMAAREDGHGARGEGECGAATLASVTAKLSAE